MVNYLEWKRAFSDPICIKIMLYLAKYNPNVPRENLFKGLEINEDTFDEKINILLASDLIRVKKDFFTLTDYGRVGLKNIVRIAKVK